MGLGWIVLTAAVVFMYRVAEFENRSGVFWGGVTFILCILSTMLIPLPFINICIAVVLSFAAMFVVKLLEA